MHLVGMDTLLILLSLEPGNYHPRGQDITTHPPLEDRRPRRSTPTQEPPLLATSMCLVSSYAMPCDHSGPTCAMCHIPKPPSPLTPVKPRGSALIPIVTPRPIPGPVVLTPSSSLGSYIVPIDQHEASEKEDAPSWYGYSINSIKPWARKSPSQGPGYHSNARTTCPRQRAPCAPVVPRGYLKHPRQASST
jgi:hypothetical protein